MIKIHLMYLFGVLFLAACGSNDGDGGNSPSETVYCNASLTNNLADGGLASRFSSLLIADTTIICKGQDQNYTSCGLKLTTDTNNNGQADQSDKIQLVSISETVSENLANYPIEALVTGTLDGTNYVILGFSCNDASTEVNAAYN